ncbi:MarR family transcriptional regulator [Corynebacterium atypicum]|uniref:MarR family transcriptional regulator n=1 Tax=Corynebacterium atypicum TaxID=191610 RepID=A0ABN4DC92_9CORY|nr:DUF488 family protein [Corynebacterium atypicum]AIG63827.1 MarR family transcriptional regulator [Corynebacterium atypicum]
MSIYVEKVHDVLAGKVQTTGTVVLVDRLWPRGIKKDELSYDYWLKSAAPSPGLRKWFGHDPNRFDEFSRRYRAELDAALSDAGSETRAQHAEREQGDVDKLISFACSGDVTLLFSTKDRVHNHARVLAGWLAARTSG